ncbi:MAG TPA: ribonuclease D [Chromatiaceae bacterium]|jgi:ribonuclease D|nr:ribonuclease D [Chromatiaceae bacterium]HIN83191.1 ribonuclease D [Chromatiales bacterium]HIA08972.1 ribonuclease D [Chromatiaceae bacterium]HIB83083.1 ribonuclease D [Chromatiaceae bacterium]HIO14415.1 ribonuclease D [Chromatiales bacterium]
MTQTNLISTPEALQTLCTQLADSDWLTLDTEFLREKTYYAQLCLIQVANADSAVCIDAIALNTAEALQPLFDLLFDPNIVKVFHASSQDLEIFYQLAGKVPEPIFDTQIAATITGYGDQIGYANLVEKIEGVKLSKTQSRTDWSLRPLSNDQIAYALDDVTYLRDIYLKLDQALKDNGRVDWVKDDFEAISRPQTYEPNIDTIWRKLRGANKLHGVQLAALQLLTRWREETARSKNRPRRWIIKDDVLVDIARFMPKKEPELGRLRGLDQGTLKHSGAALFAIIEQARQLSQDQWPDGTTAKPRLTANQDALVDALMAVLRLVSANHKVSASTLATRKELEQVVHGDTEVPLLHGWRNAIAGDQVRALLEGKSKLAVDNGVLVLG